MNRTSDTRTPMLFLTRCSTLLLSLFFLCTAALETQTALANTARRVALIVGNSAYDHVTALSNPNNDADEVAKKFRDLGFSVQLLKNVGRNALRDALGEFSNAAMGAEVGVVFYAGHGIEVDRQNYLLPVDAKLKTDLRVRFEAVSLDDVLASLEGVTGIRIVMLDACRNNPFISSMKVTTANRSISRGLSSVEPSVGTLVSFAAKEGTTAADGAGKHSPYTTALLQNLDKPGLEVNKLFRLVRDDVLTATGGEQEPYTYGSTSGADVFLKEPTKEPPASPVPVQPAVPTADEVLTDFQLAKELNTAQGWELFLQKHKERKGNFYVGLAREMSRRQLESEKRASGAIADTKSEPVSVKKFEQLGEEQTTSSNEKNNQTAPKPTLKKPVQTTPSNSSKAKPSKTPSAATASKQAKSIPSALPEQKSDNSSNRKQDTRTKAEPSDERAALRKRAAALCKTKGGRLGRIIVSKNNVRVSCPVGDQGYWYSMAR